MNYKEALEFIHNTNQFGSKLGLENITILLELLGNPQDKCRMVHVAGTNGKGSAVSYIAEVLQRSGYTVGKFISPFIERFSERISINGVEIPEGDFVSLVNEVKEKIDRMVKGGHTHPTEFEIITAIAFMYYERKKCDIIVLEVGLGGRLDATNVIKVPEVAVLTPISLDHTHILGDSLGKIAYEKSGIIKEGGSVVSFLQEKEAMDMIQEICSKRNAELKIVSPEAFKKEDGIFAGGVFAGKWADGETVTLRISLIGAHQVNNAILAFETLKVLKEKGYNISKESLAAGFLNTKWAGRLEVVKTDPYIIIDGAHNVNAAEALADFLKKLDQKIIMIIGVMKDKDVDGLLKHTVPFGEKVYTVSPKTNRGMGAEQLAEAAGKYCDKVTPCNTVREALTSALKEAAKSDIIIAFGSLYYIGEVKKLAAAMKVGEV